MLGMLVFPTLQIDALNWLPQQDSSAPESYQQQAFLILSKMYNCYVQRQSQLRIAHRNTGKYPLVCCICFQQLPLCYRERFPKHCNSRWDFPIGAENKNSIHIMVTGPPIIVAVLLLIVASRLYHKLQSIHCTPTVCKSRMTFSNCIFVLLNLINSRLSNLCIVLPMQY